MKIQKIIRLIKQSYDQPLLFHKLHCHLVCVLKASNPLLEVSDEWTKMLIYSAIQSKHPNQSLETKILALLKSIRPPIENKGSRLKLWIILYYMKNRPTEQINHLIVFELINNFMGISAFTDGFILSVLASSILGPSFGLPRNRRLRDDSIVHLLSMVNKRPLELLNKALALPCYISYDVEPQGLSELDVQDDVLTLQALERICFYAKYAKHVGFVKKVVPDSPLLVESLKRFISKSFETKAAADGKYDLKECIMEDLEVFDNIKRAYELAYDKRAFVSKVLEFVAELE